MSLAKSVIKGAQWTTVGMACTSVLQLLKFAVLARLLAPEEFGLMVIVLIVIGFSQAFSDMGISSAIIYRQDITHVQLSSLYWLNIMSGITLAGIVIGLSPVIATFFEQPDLQVLTMVTAPVFIFTAISQQFRILCQKEMQFATIALVTVFAELVATGAAIYFALQDHGVWALVYSMLIASALTSFAFLVIGVRRHHKPSWVYRHRELNGIYSFGLYQMGERSLNYFSANIDKILIGKMVGMNAVGFYNMAWQLIIFPLSRINPIVNMVAFPAYAKLQLEPERRELYYTASVKLLSLITLPLLVFLFFYTTEIVFLVFGAGWEPTAILVQILAMVGIGKVLGNPGGALILSLGRADIGFWFNVFWMLLVSTGMYLALWYRPTVESAAYMLLALSMSTGFIWHYLLARIGKLNYWPIARHFIKVLAVSILLGISTKFLSTQLSIESNFLILLTGASLFSLLYIGYLALAERKFLEIVLRSR